MIENKEGRLTLHLSFQGGGGAGETRRVGAWMREEGFKVREDAVGNLIGRLEGTMLGAKTLLLGSHLDTVRNGVVLTEPGSARRWLPWGSCKEGMRFPFAIEVIGFSEEEGVRFSSGYIGSKGYAGTLSASDLALKDRAGMSVRAAIERWSGLPVVGLPKAAHLKKDLLGYVEVHIEQGPVLEAKGLPLGVVSAIAGQTRGQFTFTGRAGHAGTTPMELRRDAWRELRGIHGFCRGVCADEKAARGKPSVRSSAPGR